MTSISSFYRSSVGCKMVMALTGLGLVGFLCAHLAGNLLVFKGPEAMNHYARTLRDYLPVLWVLRVGLIAIFILHIASAVRLTQLNRAARPVAYAKKKNVQSSFSSRSMMLSGLVVLSFVCYHLAHLTFRWTHAEFRELGDFDVYQMLVLSFRSPYVAFFYCLSIVLLLSHLYHGIVSLFQSLGLYHGGLQPMIRAAGAGLSLLLAVGFLSIPTAIFCGWIGL
jgi:succinate dehydrogenase / fumarate reductase cytochrome b subunit